MSESQVPSGLSAWQDTIDLTVLSVFSVLGLHTGGLGANFIVLLQHLTIHIPTWQRFEVCRSCARNIFLWSFSLTSVHKNAPMVLASSPGT